MDIHGISGAATVAIASSAVFVLVARSWHRLSRVIGVHSRFADSIMREAAQRFRDEFERLSSKQSTYLGACIVFLVLFVAAYELNAERLYLGYPLWQLYILFAALLCCVLLSAQQLLKTSMECHRVRLLRDSNIAVGQGVQRIAADLGYAYHDVDTAAGMIDHLIISANGACAINVVAKRPVMGGQVSLNGTDLVFSPAGDTETIVQIGAAIAALEREFRRLLDHRVRVRSVIAVPGWEIDSQSSEEHLLVNEKSLPMLRGWKDKNDLLIDEDADALHALLASRCSLASKHQDAESGERDKTVLE
jgi:hypothetical protein